MSRSSGDLKFRLARLDDVAGITDVHTSHVRQWCRKLGNETYEVSPDALTVDDRWGFGGPWMSVETCAIHLNNVLVRRFLPVIAELDGRVVAEMELFIGREGPRYGMNCHIGLLFVHRDFMGRGIGNRLVERAVAIAKEHNCNTLTVASDETHENFYRRCGFSFGEAMILIEAYPEKRPVEIVKLPPQVSAQSFAWGMEMAIGRVQSSALHLFELSEAFALPLYGEISKRVSYLKIDGSDAMVAHVRHNSGRTMVGAWSRGAGTDDVVDAALTIMGDDGVRTAYMYLYKKDYEAIAGRFDARLMGQRRTLMMRL
jgi:GNAT superfamily N-acetyltransferase